MAMWRYGYRVGRSAPDGWGDLPTYRLAGAGKGAMTRPFTIPGLDGVPAVGKAPSSGILSTGREPHAIPGVTLPFAVILTAPRFRSPRHPARQTAWGFGLSETSKNGGYSIPSVLERRMV